MLKMYVIIFVIACIAGIIIGRLSVKNSEFMSIEDDFKNMLNDFNGIYDTFYSYLDKDMLIHEISSEIEENSLFTEGCVLVPIASQYQILAIDTIQLRHFLEISGECIIKFEEEYKKAYKINYDVDEYNVFLEKMRNLRQICMKD